MSARTVPILAVVAAAALLVAGAPTHGTPTPADGAPGAPPVPVLLAGTTSLKPCTVDAPCMLGPFDPAEDVVIGLAPAFTGEVTVSLVAADGAETVAGTCRVPGACPLMIDGGDAVKSAFTVKGEASDGATGAYVLWVMTE